MDNEFYAHQKRELEQIKLLKDKIHPQAIEFIKKHSMDDLSRKEFDSLDESEVK